MRRWSLAAGLLVSASCQDRAGTAPPALPAVGGQVSLIRVPRYGGQVEVYAPDSLDKAIWLSRADLKPVRQVLGVDVEDRLLFLIDSTDALIAVDLEARGVRGALTKVRQATIVPDGSVYVTTATNGVTHFTARTPTSYKPEVAGPLRFLVGTLGDRFVVATGTEPAKLLVMNAERMLHSTELPDGEPAATYWGDLVAVPTPSGVSLFETSEPFASYETKVSGTPHAVAFSPSGHRFYVARGKPDLVVYDRFSSSELTTIPLPGRADRIRTDASGRWMLAKPFKGDSVWVIDLATNRLATTVRTEWQDDLPSMAGANDLLVRQGEDVVDFRVEGNRATPTGTIRGGASDFWLVTSWVPRERAKAATAAAESASVAQDSMLIQDSSAGRADSVALYLQVSSSQNAEWSAELIKQLKAGGFPAAVLPPGTADEGYRVVVGPYSTRDAAEEVGRKLGRPYFILTNPPIKR